LTIFTLIRASKSLKNGYLNLVKLYPKTGRTHQLRIHLSKIGNPILGDQLYGPKNGTLKHKGLFLCATKLELDHPSKNERIKIEINAPEKFKKRMENENIRWNKYRRL